jgi:hypothetical protein
MAVGARRKRREPWHAVTILPRGEVCAEVLALVNRRFLSTQAPKLPLKGCPFAATCECIYQHYTDRREGPRRDSDETGVRRRVTSGVERRAGRGRRREDSL